MTFQPLEDVAGPSISGRTLKVHNYPDNPNHDLHTSYIMNNPEAPDRFGVILGDVSHNFWPQHSSVRQIILLLRDAYKSLATHYKQAIFLTSCGKGTTWMYGSCPRKDECPCTEGVPYHRSTSCFCLHRSQIWRRRRFVRLVACLSGNRDLFTPTISKAKIQDRL